MNEIEFRKALARLQSFRQNLPEDDIEERYVIEYHDILNTFQELARSFQDLQIPDSALARRITGYYPPSPMNHFQEETNYSDSRYCERELFLMRLDAALIFLETCLPKQSTMKIGF